MPAPAFRELVRRYERALATPLPPSAPAARPRRAASAEAPVALLLSPHPDDEVITGALPLRLHREAGARVVNVAVTLGSEPRRRAARAREVAAACARLDWDLEILGWTDVTPAAARARPAEWRERASALAELIRRHRPRWVFSPHADDWHPAHRGTHLLAAAALKKLAPPAAPPWRVLTEFWHPLAEPNLLVACPPPLLAELAAALGCHRGEVARNPYHRALPAWMVDNVRRGAERVAGRGARVPKFSFGTLYRVEPALPPGWPAVLGPGKFRFGALS